MKRQLILSILFTSFSLPLFAQSSIVLTPVAEVLFKNVQSTLTGAERNDIAAQLGFILSGDENQPFALDKDSKDFPFGAIVLPTDMNKDGREEIFVSFGNSYTSGNTGSSISLFIKNAAGAYILNLGFPGVIPDALATSNVGYPDLLIGGPGFEYPVWRWNGKAYSDYKTVKDKDYEKLRKTNIEGLSKSYQQNIPQ